MATFQLFDSDGNHLDGIMIEADSARDACRIGVYRIGPDAEVADVQAINVDVPDDSPLRRGIGHGLWHGVPEAEPTRIGVVLDTTDYADGRCAKYCTKCDERIPRGDVVLAMDEPERCESCGDDYVEGARVSIRLDTAATILETCGDDACADVRAGLRAMAGSEPMYLLHMADDAPAITTGESFLRVNAELDDEEKARILALTVGETFESGGGAAPSWWIRREV